MPKILQNYRNLDLNEIFRQNVDFTKIYIIDDCICLRFLSWSSGYMIGKFIDNESNVYVLKNFNGKNFFANYCFIIRTGGIHTFEIERDKYPYLSGNYIVIKDYVVEKNIGKYVDT